MGVKTMLTIEELGRLPNDEDLRLELDEGELIKTPPEGLEHGGIKAVILYRLCKYVKENPIGKVFPSDTGFVLGEGTLRSPGLAFVRKDRLPAVRQTGFFRGAPDLCVEVVSPSESGPQLMRKVRQYLKAGARTVWLVYPATREVYTCDAMGGDRILREDEILDAPDLLPGFAVRISELFE
jgi:Uma2 family endonuclease